LLAVPLYRDDDWPAAYGFCCPAACGVMMMTDPQSEVCCPAACCSFAVRQLVVLGCPAAYRTGLSSSGGYAKLSSSVHKLSSSLK